MKDRVAIILAILIVLGALLFAGCGSSSQSSDNASFAPSNNSDNVTNLGSLTHTNKIGTYDGFNVHQFETNGVNCIFMDEDQGDSMALSCVPIPTTTTTIHY